jgi:hypothetical protein
MNPQDRGNYLKALLILVGKDKKIVRQERENLIKLANILGFGKEFCDEAMNEYFENEYLVQDPPKFSDKKIAEAFLLDGIRLAVADKELHLFELNWLKSIADINGIHSGWGFDQYEKIKGDEKKSLNKFFIEDLLTQNEVES